MISEERRQYIIQLCNEVKDNIIKHSKKIQYHYWAIGKDVDYVITRCGSNEEINFAYKTLFEKTGIKKNLLEVCRHIFCSYRNLPEVLFKKKKQIPLEVIVYFSDKGINEEEFIKAVEKVDLEGKKTTEIIKELKEELNVKGNRTPPAIYCIFCGYETKEENKDKIQDKVNIIRLGLRLLAKEGSKLNLENLDETWAYFPAHYDCFNNFMKERDKLLEKIKEVAYMNEVLRRLCIKMREFMLKNGLIGMFEEDLNEDFWKEQFEITKRLWIKQEKQ